MNRAEINAKLRATREEFRANQSARNPLKMSKAERREMNTKQSGLIEKMAELGDKLKGPLWV